MRTTNPVEVGNRYRDLSTHWRKGAREVEVTGFTGSIGEPELHARANVRTWVQGIEGKPSRVAAYRLASKSQFTLISRPASEALQPEAERLSKTDAPFSA